MLDPLREAVPVPEGTLSVLTAGAGPVVVLLHGIPTSAELWRDLLTPLAETGRRALAPDLGGYGLTRLTATADYSLAGSAELVASWLRRQGLAPAWVVGHDTGGAVAQILAVRAPDVVTRLTLVNSIVDGCWPAPRARMSILAAKAGLHRPGAALGIVPNPYMRREIRRAFADPERAGAVDAARIFWDGKFTDAQGRREFQRHLAALTPKDTAAIAAELATLPIPVQLVWGMQDPFQRWDSVGRRLLELVPDAAVAQLDGCGHFPPLECPQRLLAAMLDEHLPWTAPPESL